MLRTWMILVVQVAYNLAPSAECASKMHGGKAASLAISVSTLSSLQTRRLAGAQVPQEQRVAPACRQRKMAVRRQHGWTHSALPA